MTLLSTLPPMRDSIVGVVGGGQLARMLHQEAVPSTIDVCYLVDDAEDPVAQVSPSWMVGSALSLDDLRRFADTVDVVTFEHEVVSLDALFELEWDGVLLRPGAAAFATVADKQRMRGALAGAGLPVPPSRIPGSPEEAADIVDRDGVQVLKVAHGGYDGRGTHVVADPERAAHLLAMVQGSGGVALMEPFLDLELELAVLVVRRPGGEVVIYDPVRTIQVDGQCRRIDAPAPVDAVTASTARDLAQRAAETVDAVGVLAVELFVADGEMMINELAARPHNSGHHTLDGAVTSQFSNHLRAVLDLPLGDPSLTSPVVVTANVIARDVHVDPRDRVGAALDVDRSARVHLYGKTPRPDRKVGHVTVCDDDHDRAVERVRRVVEALGGQEVPA